MSVGRKDLIRDYKERKRPAGVYAVRCLPTDRRWVGTTVDLDTRRNGVWFTLRMGGCSNRDLQAAWTAHGEAAFAFEVLEVIDDEALSPIGQGSLLKDRRGHWSAALDAQVLTR